MLALMTVMCFDGVMRLPPLSVSGEDRLELESWVRARTIDARYAQRARIVLLAADGESNRAIGDIVGKNSLIFSVQVVGQSVMSVYL